MTRHKGPRYGTSLHYCGVDGKTYFAWQDMRGPLDGRINARRFQPLIAPEDLVLDFGCGGGHLLASLRCGDRIGVEINASALEVARAQGIHVYSDIAEVDDGVVDVVISNHALEHVPFPIAALREMHRTLRPRGKLALCVPMDDWRSQRHYSASDINHHLNTWTPQLLGNTLTESGFVVRERSIRVLTHAWPPGYDLIFAHFRPMFDPLCRIYSALRHRRQLFALVTAD